VPDLLTANAGRVAVRCSPHPAVIALCEASGFLLVASSANTSGQLPASTPEDLDPELLHNVAGVFVAGPPPAGGLPSTVVDISVERAGDVVRILRQGAVSEQDLLDAGFQVINAPEIF
jgi:L-threonylcarbamoyladenylate synthase